MVAATGTALILGASRGLGLGLAEAYLSAGWQVIATQRSRSDGLAAARSAFGERLSIEDLDITDDSSLVALRQRHATAPIDLLCVVAGVNTDRDLGAGAVASDEFARLMTTNAMAPMRVLEMFADLVPATGSVVVLTSRLGSIAANTSGGNEVYRASKAALNSMLRSFSARHPSVSLVAMHPGWVRTDMGGSGADVGVEESVAGMVAVTAARAGHPGCVFLDFQGETIAW